MLARRDFLARMGVGAVIGLRPGLVWSGRSASGERTRPLTKPLWLGFGIGAGAGEIPVRFAHISKLPQTLQSGSTPYLWVTQAIDGDLRAKVSDLVEVDPAKNANKGSSQLAAMLDYENVVNFPQISVKGLRENFFFMRLAGQGVVLGFDDGGWRLLSSFPFYIKRTGSYGSEGLLKAVQAAYPDVLSGASNSFRSTFVDLTGRFGRWREGFGNIFAKVSKVEIRPEVATVFAQTGIADRFTEQSLGLAASAALCRGLAIPVVPFRETRALADFTLRFSDSAAIQNIRLPEGDAIDFRVEVVLIGATVKSWRNQQQGWHDVTRSLTIGVVFKDHNDQVLLKCACFDEDKDISADEKSVVPERHLERFDLIFTGVIDQLFAGMLNKDATMLDGIGARDVGAKLPLSKSPALATVLAKAEKVR